MFVEFTPERASGHTDAVSVRRWSLARQLLLLQVVLLVLVIGAGAVAVGLQTRREVLDSARGRVTVLARSLAASPWVLTQVTGPQPSATLQPFAHQVCRTTGVNFVVFMSPQRIRYSHPNASLIGKPYIGTIAPALAGGTVTETYTGTLGPSVRTVAPIVDARGRVVALVSVGITTQAIGKDLARQVPVLVLLAGLTLAVAVLGALLVSRRLRRQTHGLGPAEITRMYEYYDAVLHSVREGLLLVDRRGTVQLANDEARRLLGLTGEPVGRDVRTLDLPSSLREVLATGSEVVDELHLAGDRVLVVTQLPARWDGRLLGTVATLRDRTELVSLTGELDMTRAFADSLRAQAHESANRMHTLVSLVELGRPDEAVRLATEELQQSQELVDRVVDSFEEPVLAALLLGKTSQAAERGVELSVTPDSGVAGLPLVARDLVTVLGNLVDNAIDAAAGAGQPRRVEVTLRVDGSDLLIRVADSGPGLDPEAAANAFRRGWTTKPASQAHGRGIGLALVDQVVRRHGGRIEVGAGGPGAVFTVRLPLPVGPSAGHPAEVGGSA